MKKYRLLPVLMLVSVWSTQAQMPSPDPASEKIKAEVEFAKSILKDSIAIPTEEGRGEVIKLAHYYARILTDAGFTDSDIKIKAFQETATFAATLRGREPGKPTLLISHMDVVTANPADWTRDPYIPIEEDGYVFGRGALDNKFGMAMQVATLAKLKRQGYVPRHDIIMIFSGDEETTQKSAVELAKEYKGAALVLNSDAGGGTLSEEGEPRYYSIQAAEKSYSDFQIEFTNAGGHSSRPTKINAITQLARALTRLGEHQFEPQRNELTAAALSGIANLVEPQLGDAMRRFVSTPDDTEAVEIIRSYPEYVGQIGTTCVATMVDAGHAQNALPQRATANINCRIFPGVGVHEVKAELERVIDDPMSKVTISWEPAENTASPLRKDVIDAISKAVHARYPGLPIIPSMSAGTTDSILFRAEGMDCYGVSGLFMKPSDVFAHGLNERVPVAAIPGALEHWDSIIRSLTAN